MSEATVTEEVTLNHDDITGMLFKQVNAGIAEIIEGNKVLLASETGTGDRDIDKALKDYVPSDENDVSDLDPEIVKAAKQYEAARKALATAKNKARNLYRVKVLKEDEKTEVDDSEKEALRAKRQQVMDAIKLLKSYSEGNGLKDVYKWASELEVPQVGRQGTSTVGQKKPRAQVFVNGKLHESFGEAAKTASTLLSTEDNEVSLTSPDLVTAWNSAGETSDEFDFQGLKVKVVPKAKKAA